MVDTRDENGECVGVPVVVAEGADGIDVLFLLRFFRVHHDRFFVDEYTFLWPFVERAVMESGVNEPCTLAGGEGVRSGVGDGISSASSSHGAYLADDLVLLQPRVCGCVSRGVYAVTDAIISCFLFGVLSFLSLSKMLADCGVLDGTRVQRELYARQVHLLRLVNEFMDAPVEATDEDDHGLEWGRLVFGIGDNIDDDGCGLLSATGWGVWRTFWDLPSDNLVIGDVGNEVGSGCNGRGSGFPGSDLLVSGDDDDDSSDEEWCESSCGEDGCEASVDE